MNICWDNEQQSDCSGGKQITALSPYITAISNGNGKAALSKAETEGDSMSGKQLWLGKLSSLKFEKSCQKILDRSWWKHICFNGWYVGPTKLICQKTTYILLFPPTHTFPTPAAVALCDCDRIPLIRHSLTRDTLVPELLSGEAAADHTQ